jgi:hypothetical protein
MSTCERMQLTHMLEGLGRMFVPHKQHKLQAQAEDSSTRGVRHHVYVGCCPNQGGLPHPLMKNVSMLPMDPCGECIKL